MVPPPSPPSLPPHSIRTLSERFGDLGGWVPSKKCKEERRRELSSCLNLKCSTMTGREEKKKKKDDETELPITAENKGGNLVVIIGGGGRN